VKKGNTNSGLMSQVIRPIFLVMVASVMEPAWAILDLYVQDDLPVYEKPRRRSRQVSYLTRGDRVVISPKIYGRYRKVLITYEGKRRGGFIRISQMRRSYIKDRDKEKLKNKKIYIGRYSLGLNATGSYMHQGARSFNSNSQDTYDISSFDSMTFFFSIFSDIPSSKTMMLRPYLAFRSTKFEGKAKLRNANALKPVDIMLEQDFLSFGLMAKIYDSPRKSFWYGGGGELGNATESRLVIDNEIPLEVQDEVKPFFTLLYGAVGWDIPAPNRFWLNPDFRLGVIVNKKPIIMYVDALISVSYSFN